MRPSRFDAEEHMLAQQIHPRNTLPPRTHHAPTDLEQLMALQLHQQRQLQLQQQLQIHRMQQQQLLEERQDIQARQALLEQLMHADPNVTDQLLMQHLLQRDHRYASPSDHLARLKYASQQRELYDLLQRNHLEQQLLHERQLSMDRGGTFDHLARKPQAADQEMYQWNQRFNPDDNLLRSQTFHERTNRQQPTEWADGRTAEPGLWMSSEDKSRQLLMDLLHRKSPKEELFYDQTANFSEQQELGLKNYYNVDPRSRNASPGMAGTGGFDLPGERPMMMMTGDGRPDGAARSRNAAMNDGGESKREAAFRRAASACSDSDSSEPSFVEMLKGGAKKGEEMEAGQGARNAKKKGKKGRQIDPALLGFKVTSNRIMMGEIQRIED